MSETVTLSSTLLTGELFWLAVTTTMTALLWLPYIALTGSWKKASLPPSGTPLNTTITRPKQHGHDAC